MHALQLALQLVFFLILYFNALFVLLAMILRGNVGLRLWAIQFQMNPRKEIQDQDQKDKVPLYIFLPMFLAPFLINGFLMYLFYKGYMHVLEVGK